MPLGRIAASPSAQGVEAILAWLVGAVGSSEADPFVVRFLVTEYRATARDDVFEVLGVGLMRGLDRAAAEPDAGERARWLITIAEAMSVSDDQLVRDAACALLTSLSGRAEPIGIEASLRGAVALEDSMRVATAIDHLEQLVSRAYEPGEGVVLDLDRSRPGQATDQSATASALLTAYEISGRVPYPMLAEELMQTVPLDRWLEQEVGAASDAATVFCRLAAVTQDESYRAAAVTARQANYRSDAERLIRRHDAHGFESAREAARYGLALARWLDLQ